jgi:hypothetical protein
MNEIIIRLSKAKNNKVKLYIKNMVCGRCEMALTSELKNGALFFYSIGVEIATDLDDSQSKCYQRT